MTLKYYALNGLLKIVKHQKECVFIMLFCKLFGFASSPGFTHIINSVKKKKITHENTFTLRSISGPEEV